MTQNLARYHARSPRYILNTEDDHLIRVAGPRQLPWEEGTEIKNVSLTGLVFTAPEDLCPLLGEVIRIQFAAPGDRQMACHAIVTRLEEGPAGIMLVAVHFHRMEMAHRIALAQGLARRFREQLSKKGRQDLEETGVWRLLPSSFMMLLSLWLWGLFTVAITNGESVLSTLMSWLR
ncbi:MAG: PilZ domain-containing protein [Bdellovibrionaceae bacterium]|nr:PilZ domain-containing protein [Pseudobdellovibrionaceae bacterium]MBX3034476.1 PilZ domain-containing protein [Pseudobdellovibrionaceae bacterium]